MEKDDDETTEEDEAEEEGLKELEDKLEEMHLFIITAHVVCSHRDTVWKDSMLSAV